MAVGSGDGNGWVHCRCGRRHWGLFGAAGLLLARLHPRPGPTDGGTDGSTDGGGDRAASDGPGSHGVEVLLQLRAGWTHEGGTWGIPGGAADSHEGPTQSALREAWEEAGVKPDQVEVLGTHVSADHGDWRYTVVIGRAHGPVAAHAANAESDEVRWVAADGVARLPLHPGLASSWPGLHGAISALRW